jgi:hypothetical protein
LDGTPNVSHAWARTVDGAEGGTWDHAHLLGSAALDACRGYTGQSRARRPTHTWNTTPVDDGDHGGRLADQRTALQQVAAALARVLDTTMAAVDDPWPLDRRLRAVIDAHQAVLDRERPDRTRELAQAQHAAAAAHTQLAAAERTAARTRAEIDGRGPLRGLSRAGRAERRQLEDRLSLERQAVIDAAGAAAGADHLLERLQQDQRAHVHFERTEGWRRHAIADSVDRLDSHWTAVALACCRADQPLAFGVEPLRLAHRQLAGQLTRLDASLPNDRDADRRTALTEHRDTVAEQRSAQRELVDASAQHDRLARQRWPKRDSNAIGSAADRVQQAQHRLARARQVESDARTRHEAVVAHQKQRRDALRATAPERRDLIVGLTCIDDGLLGTRSQRVVEALDRPATWQIELLGSVPPTLSGRAVWCDAASRLEAHLDTRTGDAAEWAALVAELADTRELCSIADCHLELEFVATHPHQWASVAGQARGVRDRLAIDMPYGAPVQHVVRGDSGLDIGV